MKQMSINKKVIASLMAVLMVMAVTTVSVFAIGGNDADGEIFFDENYEYAGDDAQHSVTSATYDDGEVAIVFNTIAEGVPSVDADGNYAGLQDYYGSVSTSVGAVTGDYTLGTQTLTYDQANETSYVEIEFAVDLIAQDGDYTPVFGDHQEHTYYVNMNPES